MSQKVITKNPRRQERGKKSHETYMKRLKEKILEDNQLSNSSTTDRPISSTSSSTGNSMLSIPFSTDNSTTSTYSSTNTYVCDVGMLSVLAIGVSVVFAYRKMAGEVIHEQPIKPKRRHML